MLKVVSDTLNLPGFLEPAPFATIKKQISGLKILSREEKLSLLFVCSSLSVELVNFDESWYLSAYSDIKEAVSIGEFKSARHHYCMIGYFEGRFPVEIDVDEEFYCATYPDIKNAIKKGLLPGAKLHFMTKGYQEGRIPNASYCFARPESIGTLQSIKKHISLEKWS